VQTVRPYAPKTLVGRNLRHLERPEALARMGDARAELKGVARVQADGENGIDGRVEDNRVGCLRQKGCFSSATTGFWTWTRERCKGSNMKDCGEDQWWPFDGLCASLCDSLDQAETSRPWVGP
jgi:hypothetical protein